MNLFNHWISDLKHNWRIFSSDRKSILSLVTTIFLLNILTYCFQKALLYIELQQGVLLHDVLLDKIPSIDVSVWIFWNLYSCIIFGLLVLLAYPNLFTIFLQFYFLALLMRLIAILVMPTLEPPAHIIPLIDPILDVTTYNNQQITKDLFFSGHTVSALIVIFMIDNKHIKRLLILMFIILVVLILIQHIHYTIDIFGAYIVTFMLYNLVFKKLKKNTIKEYQFTSIIPKPYEH
jgi:hypothetical protein